MRQITLTTALILFALASTAAQEGAWDTRPALRVGDRTLQRSDLGRRLLRFHGRRAVVSAVLSTQLQMAIEAKKLEIDPAHLAERRKEILEDLKARGYELGSFLRKSRVSKDAFERDVWNRVASETLAKHVGIDQKDVKAYLLMNYTVSSSKDGRDPVLVSIRPATVKEGETPPERKILVRTIVEELLPMLTARDRDAFLASVISVEAVEQVLDRSVPRVSDEVLDALEKENREQIRAASGGRTTLEQFLAGRNQDLAAYREALQHTERIRRAIIAEAKEEYLRDHFVRWAPLFRGRQVRASHILIRVRPDAPEKDRAAAEARIIALKKQVDEGADFGNLAIKHSEDERSQVRQGDVGFFPRRSPRIGEPFAAAAFALAKGRVSAPVRTSAGYHLILVTDIRPGRDVSFDDPAIRKLVERDYAESRKSAWVTDRRKEAEVEILWDEFKVKSGDGE
jgi:parvulin-like peptidyl-prolyl isomerase